MIIALGLFIIGVCVSLAHLYLIKARKRDNGSGFWFGVIVALCSAQYIWG